VNSEQSGAKGGVVVRAAQIRQRRRGRLVKPPQEAAHHRVARQPEASQQVDWGVRTHAELPTRALDCRA
jgi:hypothetical protein